LHEGGLEKMHRFISETAQYGDLTRGPRVVDEHSRAKMGEVLKEIQDGTFAKEWIAENRAGRANYTQLMNDDLRHPVEKVGKKLRERMSWLKSKITEAA